MVKMRHRPALALDRERERLRVGSFATNRSGKGEGIVFIKNVHTYG